MSDDPNQPQDKDKAARQARLGEALRANLRRRKVQARGRRDADSAAPDDEAAPGRTDEAR